MVKALLLIGAESDLYADCTDNPDKKTLKIRVVRAIRVPPKPAVYNACNATIRRSISSAVL
jgi:hypothetical protein